MLEIIGILENKLDGMAAYCREVSKELETQCKSQAGWNDRTGAARQSIEGTSTGSGASCDITLSIGTDHGGILEFGSPAHVIEGNPFLYWEGALHPVARVNHPGFGEFRALRNAAESGLVESMLFDYWGL